MQLYSTSTRFSNLIAPLFGLTYWQWSSKEINKHSRTSEKKKEVKCLLDVLEMEMFAWKANTYVWIPYAILVSLLPCFIGADI